MFEGLPPGPYSTVVIDPPWSYRDGLPGKTRGAARHYETLTPLELTGLPVADLAAPDAHLYVWVTNAFVEQGLALARHWGFEPKSLLTWVKLTKTGKLAFGMGRHWRGATEHVVFATRGKRLPPGKRNLRTVFFAPLGEHSEKPEEFYRLAAEMSPAPRLDMFARQHRPGYDAWGDEVS